MTMIFMALTLVAVVVYWLNLHGPLWVDYASLFAIGFLIYGPIMMIGLHSLDLVPKKAAGTAAGLTGLFGYVFGSAIAGTGVGWIADRVRPYILLRVGAALLIVMAYPFYIALAGRSLPPTLLIVSAC